MKHYIRKQKYAILLSTLLTAFSSLLSIAVISVVQKLVDAMIGGNTELLKRMIAILAVVLIGNFLFGYFSLLQEAKISTKLHLDIKGDIFQSILKLKHIDFKKTPTGSKLSVFENDTNLVEEYYFNNIFILVRNVIIFVVAVIYLFALNAAMGALLLVCSVIILVLPMLLGKDIDGLSESYSNKKSEFTSQLKDYFEGMDVVHAYQIEERVKENFDILLKALEDKLLQFRKKLGIYNQAMVTGNYVIITISFSVGGFLVIQNRITMGELIAITQVMNIIMTPISEATTAMVEINGSSSIRKKLEAMIQSEGEEKNDKDCKNLFSHFSGIDCKNVSYTIDHEGFSLKNITLNIKPKKKYVILGPSGCGKTTLLKIIANMMEADSGELSINGVPYLQGEGMIEQFVSFVHQDTFIFNDTIENNIKLYRDYNQQVFDQAIMVTGLEEKIKDRIHSECSEGGGNLSGGEKQRISIARAILRETPVLLLDEVTSALDRITAQRIEESLFNMEDKTIVFITHKIESSFLKKADSILCMDQGRIIEQGTWNELMKEQGYFYKIYSSIQE